MTKKQTKPAGLPFSPLDPFAPQNKAMLENLQGNILQGHGRNFSANIFIQFSITGKQLKDLISKISVQYVTSAFQQAEESKYFKRFGIPGSLFGNFFLAATAYNKMGVGKDLMSAMFKDQDNVPPGAEKIFPQSDSFLKGMTALGADLGDIPADLSAVDPAAIASLPALQKWKLFEKKVITEEPELEPLEKAYLKLDGLQIDAMLLLADDSEPYLLRETRSFVTEFEKLGIQVVAIELGKALRNNEGEGIEHFGYVDGRSQPLYLTTDFEMGNPRKERINEKAFRKESGDIDLWDPKAPLEILLKEDLASNVPGSFGSYFVFRKLEQDVLRFSMAEQNLADKLKLTGKDRERAGAMAVGRFRDGTPLVLSSTDGFLPGKDNNFRYDGRDASGNPNPRSVDDSLGLKCPFQAHIRKTNPRQNVGEGEDGDQSRRITRRGIPYGERIKNPNAFQALDDLPTGGVGLLFACFQSSIVKQFSFMQKTWANNTGFKVSSAPGQDGSSPETGIDTLIGQSSQLSGAGGNPDHNWRKEYGGHHGHTSLPDVGNLDLSHSHPTRFNFSNFVKFRGGEFFFAPSIPFLTQSANNKPK
ncbi:Dyp-type peroxidase [Pedobacter hartonius]|uniref:Dyp-type peroxidase family n=1 Tax=Pedobacter hartonius TaxID=425514 RepID=A0A1H4HKM8_9SPHI|nr:hypothetical protein [Pedobacter hartonius]SEB22156.1 Dyp-type peroxidase family [Pedobacter hartonius]